MAEKAAATNYGVHTLFVHQTGPLVQFDGNFLCIEDLNPQVKTRWRMSRREMLAFGFKSIWAALFA